MGRIASVIDTDIMVSGKDELLKNQPTGPIRRIKKVWKIYASKSNWIPVLKQQMTRGNNWREQNQEIKNKIQCWNEAYMVSDEQMINYKD